MVVSYRRFGTKYRSLGSPETSVGKYYSTLLKIHKKTDFITTVAEARNNPYIETVKISYTLQRLGFLRCVTWHPTLTQHAGVWTGKTLSRAV